MNNIEQELLGLTTEFLKWCDDNPIPVGMDTVQSRPPDLLQFAWWLQHVKIEEAAS